MAVRAAFIDDPGFLVSFGGFHPEFVAPDDFPDLDPVGVALDTGEALRVSVGGYFALTSNSVQFGARAELWAGVEGFSIEGGTSFDTLINFDPFAFSIRLRVWVSVVAAGTELLGVLLEGRLSGPNPWRVSGVGGVPAARGSRSASRSTRASASWPTRARRRRRTRRSSSARRSPSTTPGRPSAPRATIRSWSPTRAPAPAVHPSGRVQVTQRLVPLDTTIECYGNAELVGPDLVDAVGSRLRRRRRRGRGRLVRERPVLPLGRGREADLAVVLADEGRARSWAARGPTRRSSSTTPPSTTRSPTATRTGAPRSPPAHAVPVSASDQAMTRALEARGIAGPTVQLRRGRAALDRGERRHRSLDRRHLARRARLLRGADGHGRPQLGKLAAGARLRGGADRMSAELRYLSYVRRGLARSIGDQADSSGIPRTRRGERRRGGGRGRRGENPTRCAVRGPGSVVGLAPGEVVRVDPPDGATDHAANMFASVELRTADLPWLFTPARPRGERLIPWLVLVVVEDREGNSLTRRRLRALGAQRRRRRAGAAGPERGVGVGACAGGCRVHRPRRAPGRHARAGVRATALPAPPGAGLRLLRVRGPELRGRAAGRPRPHGAGRLGGARLGPTRDSDVRLPVLHSWSFRTAPEPADFEELVRRLDPQPFGPDVGVHDLDLSDPGSTRLPSRPVTVGYEGALGSPEMRAPPWRDPARAEFRSAMGLLLEDAAPGEPRAEGEPYVAARHDPVVAPPRYGALPGRDRRHPGARCASQPRRRRAGSRRRTSTRSTAPRRAWEPRWSGSTRRR